MKKYKSVSHISSSLENVSLSYGSRNIFSSLGLSLASGQRILLQGPSGSGKTSILHLLAGLLKPNIGSVSYMSDLSTINTHSAKFSEFRRDCIAMTFSEPLFFDNLSVKENILFPHTFLGKVYRIEWMKKLISTLKIDILLDSKAGLLSSGEKDRVNIIRAILYDDPILLLDEPGAHMDSALLQDFIYLLEEYFKEIQPTTIIVSHSDIFMKIVDSSYFCENGTLLLKK